MGNLNCSLLWHSLGIDETRRESYRNFFGTGSDSTDFPDLMDLVKADGSKVEVARYSLIGG